MLIKEWKNIPNESIDKIWCIKFDLYPDKEEWGQFLKIDIKGKEPKEILNNTFKKTSQILKSKGQLIFPTYNKDAMGIYFEKKSKDIEKKYNLIYEFGNEDTFSYRIGKPNSTSLGEIYHIFTKK